jgi:NitT/TauT family transport system substrate-binding protein
MHNIHARQETTMNALYRLCAACFTLTSLIGSASAEDVKIKFTLDWKAQGPHAWYYVARDKGYFKQEGLDVTIDQGEGSASTVTRIISGVYDAGFGDMNAIIQNAAQRPGQQPVMVYMIYNKSPFALITRADGPIRQLKDIEGHSLGVPAGSATHRMMAPLAKKNGIDMTKINVVNVAPNLVEQMLTQSKVDLIAAFAATTYMNIVALHQDPEKDFRWFFYDEYGLDLYSNGVMVSQKLAKENPAAVRGLVKAINRALREVAADPDMGIATLMKVEPLLKADIERARLIYFLDKQIVTPEEKRVGLGDVDNKRMNEAIATVVDAYELPRTPKLEEVFDASFLPPKADRELTSVKR